MWEPRKGLRQAERLEQAKMFGKLSLLCEEIVWRKPYLVMNNFDYNKVRGQREIPLSVPHFFELKGVFSPFLQDVTLRLKKASEAIKSHLNVTATWLAYGEQTTP